MRNAHDPLSLDLPEDDDEADAHGAACLTVLEHAILLTRARLRQDRLAACQQRELHWLMDAVHNLPAAVGGAKFWDRGRVVAALAGYDSQFSPPNQHPHRASLQGIYRATHDARRRWRADVRDTQRRLLVGDHAAQKGL